jgi:hypothetical protein
VWLALLLACAVLCALETAPRLGAASPDTRFTLPQFSLGYFWGTPLGWTGLVDGVSVNRDSVQFASLAGFFRDAPHVPVPPQDNVYVRFAGYSLVGSSLAPLLGDYASFVLINLAFWLGGAWATYVLGSRKTGSPVIGVLAAALVATAPAFEALVGQSLPYVASYGLFALGLLLLDQARAFDADRPLGSLVLVGFGAGVSLLFYDVYMLPAFAVVYGVLRRARLTHIVVLAACMLVPRLLWSGYWQAMHLPSYSHNEQHPVEALLAWFDTARVGAGVVDKAKGYAFLLAHGLLNIGAVFLFWPLLLAVWELWQRRRTPEAGWFAAVLVAGFGPALFMLSTWPHIPRWYAYGFPAVYVLASAAAIRLVLAVIGVARVERPRLGLAGAALALVVLAPALLLANLDVLGFTRPMELLLFQPSSWAYLWSR